MKKRVSSVEDIPHDDLYIEAYGKDYRTHPEFIAKMGETIHGTRDIGNVRADIGELVVHRRKGATPAAKGGW